MGNECCTTRWNPCPGLDVSSNVDSVGQRYQINRNPFWRQKFLIGDKEIPTPKGLQNPAYHEDFDSPLDKNRASNAWERPTLTVPTEAVAAAIAAATAATAPIPPPRTKRNRRATTQLLHGSHLPVTPDTTSSYPQKDTLHDPVTITCAPENPSNKEAPPESPEDNIECKDHTTFFEESKDTKDEEPTNEPKDITENKIHEQSIKEATIGNQGVVVTCKGLPSVDENSILNCSNTVDLLRTVTQRHSATESEALKMKSDFSDDYPIIPAKRRTQKSDERKGSSVSLPDDDVLAKSELERSRLSKFKFKEKRGGEFDLSVAGTEEHEREEIKSRIKGEATSNDDYESSSNSESEQEDVLRRSSASSGTLEPYDTACSGDETKETTEEFHPSHPSLKSLSPPPTPENSPRRESIDEFTNAPIVTQRSASENADSISRSMSPNLTQIALSKSAILLTPRQWKPAHTSVTPEHRNENVPEVHVTAEPSDHQKHTRDAMTSFIKGTYSDKLEVPDRPQSAASSTTGSLGELEEDIYKLLSESKDKHCEDDDDNNAPPTSIQEKFCYQEDPQSAISDVPICSSAELVRKQQELYIKSMRELRSEDGREQ